MQFEGQRFDGGPWLLKLEPCWLVNIDHFGSLWACIVVVLFIEKFHNVSQGSDNRSFKFPKMMIMNNVVKCTRSSLSYIFILVGWFLQSYISITFVNKFRLTESFRGCMTDTPNVTRPI